MRACAHKCMEHSFMVATIISATITGAVFVFLLYFGIPLFQHGQILELLLSNWAPEKGLYGIYPMLIASIILAALSLAISFPTSLGASFFISYLSPPKISNLMLNLVRFMTGIPTVVYSFAALFLLVPFMRDMIDKGSGLSILTASLVLALLISPTMIIFFVNSFQKVPVTSLLAAAALGATPVQKIFYIVLPQAWPGIINGLLLGFGRALGDTMVSLMLAGNSPSVPESIFDSARTLTAHIGLVLAFDFDSMEFKSVFVCGLVLYILSATTMTIIRLISKAYVHGRN